MRIIYNIIFINQTKSFTSPENSGQSYLISSVFRAGRNPPIPLFFVSFAQCVCPVLFMNAIFLCSRTSSLADSLGSIVTVRERRTKSFLWDYLNSSDGEQIFPPWTVLESHKIKSPASHSTSWPLSIKGSLLFSYSQSEAKVAVDGYLCVSFFWVESLLVFGTTIKPPTSSFLTRLRGIIPWTHLNPLLKKGLWSTCKFSTEGIQLLFIHQGFQPMNVSKLVIRFLVFQIFENACRTLGWHRKNHEACVWHPP